MNILNKSYTENQPSEIFIIDYVLKINRQTYKTRDLKREEIKRGFYDKELLPIKLQMSYYPEPDPYQRQCQSSIRIVKLCNQERVRPCLHVLIDTLNKTKHLEVQLNSLMRKKL